MRHVLLTVLLSAAVLLIGSFLPEPRTTHPLVPLSPQVWSDSTRA